MYGRTSECFSLRHLVKNIHSNSSTKIMSKCTIMYGSYCVRKWRHNSTRDAMSQRETIERGVSQVFPRSHYQCQLADAAKTSARATKGVLQRRYVLIPKGLQVNHNDTCIRMIITKCMCANLNHRKRTVKKEILMFVCCFAVLRLMLLDWSAYYGLEEGMLKGFGDWNALLRIDYEQFAD